MSTFHGPQGKGAMRHHRDKKRHEAEQRAIARNLTRLANEARRRVRVTLTADASGFAEAAREATIGIGRAS